MAGISVDIGDDTGVIVEPPKPGAKRPPPIPPAAKAKGSGKHEAPAKARGKPKKPAPRTRKKSPDPAALMTERAPRVKAPRRISVAWLLLLLVVGAGGVGGYYLFERWQTAEEALRDARIAIADANERTAAADQRVIEARAAAARSSQELEQLRGRLDGAKKRAVEADELAGRLQKLIGEQGTVVRDKEKLTVEMVDKVLFRSGEAVLTEKGDEVLRVVGEELKKLPEKQIWVQGHTDDVPIANDLFASNWELSTTRALTVVHYLEEVSGIDPRRLAAVGFGQHRPVSRNKRFRNRRIEIVLFPREVRLIKE